jgi:hypothetical protein
MMNPEGSDTNKRSLPGWPCFTEEDIAGVCDVLKSGRLNYWTGDQGRLFEKEFSLYVGTDYAIALANGTVALELALYALGIGPGDEVITSCRTFIASASAIVMRGAIPVLADVDPNSQNITAETIAAVTTPRTRAIIVVHLAGWPCEMDPILELARRHGLKVIEDCAQAQGALYKGRRTGSLGDAGAFSFCQDKIMTTGGEGGMLTTNDPAVWEKAWAYKDHGKSYQAAHGRRCTPGFDWLHESFGTNWRMTEMQAVLGRRALSRLDDWLRIRRRNACILTEAFRHLAAVRITEPPAHVRHAYYKYYVFLRSEKLRPGWNRQRILETFAARGIPALTGSCSEIYMEKAFVDARLAPLQRLPVARELGESSLMFLIHPTLDEQDMQIMARIAREVFFMAGGME